MKGLRQSFFQALLLFIMLGAAWLLFFLKMRKSGEEMAEQTAPAASSTNIAEEDFRPSTVSKEAASATGDKDTEHPSISGTFFDDAVSALATATPAEARLILNDLAAQLAAMPRAEAVAVLQTFLASGADAPTGLPFRVGAEHAVEDVPSLRAFALDQLGRLDPEAAAALAPGGWTTTTSAAEYTLHLRNYAWGSDGVEADQAGSSGPVLREAFTSMLVEPERWEGQFDALAEAHDVAVYLADPTLAPLLGAGIATGDATGTRRASYLALDRLTLQNPARSLTALVESPEVLAANPQVRAQQMARADPGDPAQRTVLENYLRSPAVDVAERAVFYESWPNLNVTLSHTLLAEPPRLDPREILPHLENSLTQAQAWRNDPTLAEDYAALDATIARLEATLRDGGFRD